MFLSFSHLIIVSISIFTLCDCFDPITYLVSGAALTFGYAGYKYLNCAQNECCDKTWIKFDNFGLEQEMERKLFGQHLAKSIVLRSLKAHMEKKDSRKALVMAFHGDTGSGKNHVSNLITQNLFKKGSDSQYVHVYIGLRHFPHKQDTKLYRDRLQREIEQKTKLCERSLFVFDEVDKISPGVLDALTPYLDYHGVIDGVDYRKNIFIFLSNAGARNITHIALKFWSNGKEREEITLKDMESLITQGAFNEEGGLHHSEIVKRELIDVYVPFLPLEKKHVKQCIASELISQHLRGNVEKIADQFTYYPPETQLFSVNGCKAVYAKVGIFAV